MLDLISIIKRTFGDVKNTGKSEIQCNCPQCASLNNYEPDDKFNLAINVNKHKFQCWKCNLKGPIAFILKRYADYADYKLYLSLDGIIDLKEYDHIENEIILPKIHLPNEFVSFKDISEKDKKLLKAWKYIINDRKFNEDLIYKFNLGYCPNGKYGNRIIFPSYDCNNELNYFSARSYISSNKLKYFNPLIDKSKIIFNESNIKFYSTVFVVEGAIDIMGLPINTSALLGKTLSLKFFEKIKEYNSNIVLVLDPDAFWSTKKIFDSLYFAGFKNNIRVALMKGEDDIFDFSIKNEHSELLSLLYTANDLPDDEMFKQKYNLLTNKVVKKTKFTGGTKSYDKKSFTFS